MLDICPKGDECKKCMPKGRWILKQDAQRAMNVKSLCQWALNVKSICPKGTVFWIIGPKGTECQIYMPKGHCISNVWAQRALNFKCMGPKGYVFQMYGPKGQCISNVWAQRALYFKCMGPKGHWVSHHHLYAQGALKSIYQKGTEWHNPYAQWALKVKSKCPMGTERKAISMGYCVHIQSLWKCIII